MSSVSRIFVVEGDESLNQSIVNALRKDGYQVQGVLNSADAVRTLWSEAYDIVLCDLKTPGIDGVEFLQWLRSYHPHTRTIIVGSPDTPTVRMQVLESGAAGYLEKPLDLHRLKEELRRLLQQSGFSASLDSFDLLDVIQIITMSRKSIAMLVSIGVEEQGILRFHNGELIWAEYGALRGEEAFFALAAHKNGTVTHHPWNGPVVSNVTQPLSRLILQSLQYRAKYAQVQQNSTEHEAVSPLFSSEEIDDTPFVVVPEEFAQQAPVSGIQESGNGDVKEWWEKTGTIASISTNRKNTSPFDSDMFASAVDNNVLKDATGEMYASMVQDQQPAPVQRGDLPSWLTDQPTAAHLASIRPTSLPPSPSLNSSPSSSHMPIVPTTPIPRRPTSPEVNVPHVLRSTDSATTSQSQTTGITNSLNPVSTPNVENMTNSVNAPQKPGDTALRSAVTPGWQTPMQGTQPQAEGGDFWDNRGRTGFTGEIEATGIQRTVKRSYNYAALVSALQTLGYSISGFIAAAVVSMDGQPIAQVAVDDLDISNQCKQFSQVLKNALQSLDRNIWGDYEDMVISSSARRTLIRLVGSEKNAFLVLITMREADAGESLEVMANVEGAITSALRP